MARAFLLHLLGSYLFANGRQTMSCLSLLHPRHSQLGHLTVAYGALEVP